MRTPVSDARPPRPAQGAAPWAALRARALNGRDEKARELGTDFAEQRKWRERFDRERYQREVVALVEAAAVKAPGLAPT